MKTCLGILRRMLLLFAVCAAPAVAAEFDAEEQNRLGDMYFNGSGEQAPNYALALKHYNNAAGRGPAQAWTGIGYIYENGIGVALSTKAAAEFYAKAADQGDPEAMYRLAVLTESGDGVAADKARAEALYAGAEAAGLAEALTRDAEAGSARARETLGSLYYKGQGVPQDYAQAFAWFSRAAEQGLAVAHANLGWMHLNGNGVPRSDAAAIAGYVKAAELGDAVARHFMALRYAYGDHGVIRDYAKAVYWIMMAAGQGLAEAQSALGDFYKHGLGVSQDAAQAAYWHDLAAATEAINKPDPAPAMSAFADNAPQTAAAAPAPSDRDSSFAAPVPMNQFSPEQIPELIYAAERYGHEELQTELGRLYEHGVTVEQDYAKAAYWYGLAAKRQGGRNARQYLGSLYGRGLGVPRDAAQAEYWYAQAGVGGSENEPANPAPGTVRQAGTSSTHFGDKIVTDDSGTTTYYPFDHGSRDDDHPHLSKIVVHPSGERTYYDTYGNSMAKGGMTSFGYVLQTAGEEQEMLNLMDSMTPEEILDIWADRITGE